jgi:DNA-binding phage protein
LLLRIDTQEVEEITEHLHRARAADTMLSAAERLVDHLKEVRAVAMRSHARDVGGLRAAEDLGMNRTSMYRAIRTGVSSAVVERDEPHWQRQAQALNGRLREQGRMREEIETWWNSTILPALNYRTPMQAWNAGDREGVLALVPTQPPPARR